MTPINKVPIGKFCRFNYSVVYMCFNDFNVRYTLLPIDGFVPRDEEFDCKVYVYKRIRKEWVEEAKEVLERYLGYKGNGTTTIGIDNLTYIENLNILKKYLKSDIVEAE